MARKKPLAKKSVTKRSLAGTRKNDINKRRKGFLAVFIPWVQRFGVGIAVVTLLIWAGSWLWLNGSVVRTGNWIENKTQLAMAGMGFEVKNILVEGRVHTDTEVLLAILNVKEGDPLFSFNPYEAQSLIEKIGWVRKAHIERRLPDTLYIRLVERQPTAIWKNGDALKLLDEKGAVIPTASMLPFKNLIVVQGEDAPQFAPDLLPYLAAEEDIAKRVIGANRISSRRWDLVFKGGLKIQLPEEDLGLALARLAKAQEEDAILDQGFMSVDLREQDRISIRTKPGQVQEYKASLNLQAGDSI